MNKEYVIDISGKVHVKLIKILIYLFFRYNYISYVKGFVKSHSKSQNCHLCCARLTKVGKRCLSFSLSFLTEARTLFLNVYASRASRLCRSIFYLIVTLNCTLSIYLFFFLLFSPCI